MEDSNSYIEYLELKIESMRKEMDRLEKENMTFRKCITEAIGSLSSLNDSSRKVIFGDSRGNITDDSSFSPLVNRKDNND